MYTDLIFFLHGAIQIISILLINRNNYTFIIFADEKF